MDLVEFLMFGLTLDAGLSLYLEASPDWDNRNWFLARESCRNRGGHLVSPNSTEIQHKLSLVEEQSKR